MAKRRIGWCCVVMKLRLLGQSGLRVSQLCLGTMTFGNTRGWGASREESRVVFDAFVEAGGNFIDTANVYQGGESERLVGEFTRERRHELVVATKYSLGGAANDANARGNSRKSMVQSLEASLRRLGTDYVDLFWMHAWDALTPDEEVVRALDDLVRAGKILYVGMSDTPAWVISRSQAIAELRGWSTLAAVQVPLSLIERTAEQEYLPMAEDLGLSVTTWGALGSGVLSGKYKPDESPGGGRLADPAMAGNRLSARNFSIVAVLQSIAEDTGAVPSQIALAWLLARSERIIPIVGARVVDQLRLNLGCLTVDLSPEQLAQLNEVSAVPLGFPWSFYRSGPIGTLLHGPTFPRIANKLRGNIDPPIRT
jgi:aryl-alcohol dehydrogenase-like predicted oxidoreductase